MLFACGSFQCVFFALAALGSALEVFRYYQRRAYTFYSIAHLFRSIQRSFGNCFVKDLSKGSVVCVFGRKMISSIRSYLWCAHRIGRSRYSVQSQIVPSASLIFYALNYERDASSIALRISRFASQY